MSSNGLDLDLGAPIGENELADLGTSEGGAASMILTTRPSASYSMGALVSSSMRTVVSSTIIFTCSNSVAPALRSMRARITATIFTDPLWVVEGFGSDAERAPMVEAFHQWKAQETKLEQFAGRVIGLDRLPFLVLLLSTRGGLCPLHVAAVLIAQGRYPATARILAWGGSLDSSAARQYGKELGLLEKGN